MTWNAKHGSADQVYLGGSRHISEETGMFVVSEFISVIMRAYEQNQTLLRGCWM